MMFWDDKIEYFLDSDISVIETPNDALQLKAKAWKQPNRSGIFDMEKGRPIKQVVIQLDPQVVNLIGRICRRRFRQAVEDRIAPTSNLPYWSRWTVHEIEQVKRLYDCVEEDIRLCVDQIVRPWDRLNDLLARLDTILQLNVGFASAKAELGP